MEIEVEWIVNIKSGLTTIDIADLQCKNKKQWYALSAETQKKRIEAYLMESDQPMLKPLANSW